MQITIFLQDCQIDIPINDVLYQLRTMGTRSDVLKDLKDIINLSISTEEILKDANYMVNFLCTKIKPVIRSNNKNSLSGNQTIANQISDKHPITLEAPKPPSRQNPIQYNKRHPQTAYFIFMKHNRQKVHEYYPELSPPQRLKVLGQLWQKMAPSEKEVYYKEYEKGREEFYRNRNKSMEVTDE